MDTGNTNNMQLEIIDWGIIIAFFITTLIIGIYYKEQSGKDMRSFFLGGGNLPWYLAGISMVATTFAADTPLAVTELVRGDGISGNWLWWNFLAGGLLTTFFFAKLWKRSGVLTEAEFIELRYSGKIAKFLRGFKAVYLGFFMNIMVIGWVNLALVSILNVLFGLDIKTASAYTIGAMVFVAGYSSLGGLKGIIITDSIQFIIAMIGSIILAYFVTHNDQITSVRHLMDQIPLKTLNFFPSWKEEPLKFTVLLGMMWWCSWYPGAEPGGGGYIAQRMMSTKNEKHAVWATLFFQIGHYALRPWPWIIVGLATIVLYPELTDLKLGYVFAIKDYLPAGLKGLLLTAFFAAYMSTISTQLNWGSSYLVNDLYGRFIAPKSTQKKLLESNWIFTIALIVSGGTLTFYIESISAVWEFLMLCGAGLGLVLILRWYWGKISAESELVAMIAPFLATAIFYIGDWKIDYHQQYIITVIFTTISWVIITYLFPQDRNQIPDFFKKVRPESQKLGWLTAGWLIAILAVYCFLFGTGYILFDQVTKGAMLLLLSVTGFMALWLVDKKKALF